MKNLAEELDFEEIDGKIKTTPLVLMKNENVRENTKNVLKVIKKNIYIILKRIVDIIGGLVGCSVLLPIMLVIKIAYLKNGDKAPILFTQTRIGKKGKEIKIYKIRSMVVDADRILYEMLELDPKLKAEYDANKKLKDDPRVTKVGKVIRKTSIDEFPQFINILKGDMTLVGPRPYLPREKDDMKDYYDEIIESKPGLTGLWQISGRSEVNFANRCRLDSFYSKRKGLLFDLKIFLRTFKVVLEKNGAV